MGKKLIIRGADFSQNGIINPFVGEWYNYDLENHPPAYETLVSSARFVPGNYSVFQGKTINAIKLKVITPGTITIAVADRITANAQFSQSRTLDFSQVAPNTIVTEIFEAIEVGDGYLSIFASTDTGSFGYEGQVSNPVGIYRYIGTANPGSLPNFSLSVDFGYGQIQ